MARVFTFLSVLLLASCAKNDPKQAGTFPDGGTAANPRGEQQGTEQRGTEQRGSTGTTTSSSGAPSSTSSNDPAPQGKSESEGEPLPIVSVPPGLGIACSDASGVPICCDEDGGCWEHGIPDDTGAEPDGSKWTDVSASTSPPGRRSHGLTYDTARERVVLFGGQDHTGNNLDDTWEYDGKDWVKIATPSAPSPRRNIALAYDEARGRVVLFGGWNEAALDDTWEYDGENWTEVTTDKVPRARDGYAITYDARRERIVLFGGYLRNSLVNDTWEYDGENWTRVPTAHAPVPRRLHAMVYDSVRERVVLFGGRGGVKTSTFVAGPAPEDECRADGGNEALSDTWEYDGVDWTQVSTSTTPVARMNFGLAYDAADERAVLFGGLDDPCTGVVLGDTWEYDGSDWEPRGPEPTPSRRFAPVLAYDAARQQVVLFGGQTADVLGDTWEFTGP